MWRAIVRAAISAFVCGVALGQGADSNLSFEVASVKLSGSQSVRMSNGGPGTQDPERFTFSKAVLRDLLYRAYAVEDPYAQISGPAWIDTQEYDIAVKIPTGATKEQFQQMLRNMLAERFKLVVHHDTKVLPVYELTVAKNGPKLKESVLNPVSDLPPPQPQPFAEDKNGFPQLPAGRAAMVMMNRAGRSRLAAQQQSMYRLITMLRAPALGRPIIDKTGLTGLYDFTLEFDPRAATGGTTVDGQDPGAPDIFIAIQQQLGLKLVEAKAPFDVVVVDQAEKTPSEN
jgi:uncharacterized protein (TIGR03435 family)